MNGRSWSAKACAFIWLGPSHVLAALRGVMIPAAKCTQPFKSTTLVHILAALCAASMTACTGGVNNPTIGSNAPPPSTPYTVGGTVSGLTGTGLVLQNNGTNNLTVTGDGTFKFSATLVSGNPYNVSVSTQPGNPTQTCVPSNATGTVGTADITDVSIICTTKTVPEDTIGGTVSGLAGTGLILQDNGGDNLPITGVGRFTFATSLPSGSPYSVSVLSPPVSPSQNCVVTAGSGTTGASDVNNVAVACTTVTAATYTIGGQVSGLPGGATLVLQDNGRDNLTISSNGSFTFLTPIPSGSAYNVSISSINDASGSLSCTVQTPGGVVKQSNVTTVAVVCTNSAALSLLSIQVTPSNSSVSAGVPVTFTAIGLYSDGSSQTLSNAAWSSSNSAVATVNLSSGIAATVGVGQTTITATSGAVSGSTTLSVTSSAPTSITLTPLTATIAKGTTQTYAAIENFANGTTQNVTATATWTSSNPGVAPNPTAGVATGTGQGTTFITASLTTPAAVLNSNQATLTVGPPVPVSLSVTPLNPPSIPTGDSETFTATEKFSDGTTQNVSATATWTSSNPSVAPNPVAGVATGAAQGTTVIAASLATPGGGVLNSNPTTLTVGPPVPVKLNVTPATQSILQATTFQFTAMATFSNGDILPVTIIASWTSSNTAVAPNPIQGLASGGAPGTTTITATYTQGSTTVSGQATLTVTAPTLLSLAISPNFGTYLEDFNYQFAAIATYNNNTTVTVTTQATWSSANPSIVSFPNSNPVGDAYFAASATTTISASFGGMTAQLQVTGVPALGFVYVTNQGDKNISGYAVLPWDGSLLFLAQWATNDGSGADPQPVGSAVGYTTNGNSPVVYLVVTNPATNTVSIYTIAPLTGTLTALQNSPFQGPPFNEPSAVTFAGEDANDNAVFYVMNSGAISILRVGPQGTSATVAITQFTDSTVGEQPYGGVVVTGAAGGPYLYVTTEIPSMGAFISGFDAPTSGGLQDIAPGTNNSPWEAGSTPGSIATDGSYVVLSVDPSDNQIWEYQINPDTATTGALEAICSSPISNLSGGSLGTLAIANIEDEDVLFATTSQGLMKWSLTGGAPQLCPATGQQGSGPVLGMGESNVPGALVTLPSGTGDSVYVYVLDPTTYGGVYQFSASVDAQSPPVALSPGSSSTGASPSSISIAPASDFN